MPSGPATGSSAPGPWRRDAMSSPTPRRMSVEASTVRCRPMAIDFERCRSGARRTRCPAGSRGRPCPAATSSGVRSVTSTSLEVPSACWTVSDDGLPGARRQVAQRTAAAIGRVAGDVIEDRERAAVDGHDEVARVVVDGQPARLAGGLPAGVHELDGLRLADDPAGHEAGGCGRRVGHDLVDADLPDRLGEERDEREDEPGDAAKLTTHAGDEDAQARAQRWLTKARGSSDSPSSASSRTKPPMGSQLSV